MSESLTPEARGQVVEAKKKFVIDLDMIRKDIKMLQELKSGSDMTEKNGLNSNAGVCPAPTYMSAMDIMPRLGGQAILPSASTIAPTTIPVFNPGHNSSHNLNWPTLPEATSNLGCAAESRQQSPGSGCSPKSHVPRRSHAIEIKDPNTHRPINDLSSSCLNPASPSYEPGKPFPLTEGSPPAFVVPAPSPIDTPNMPPAELAKQHSWVFENFKNDGNRLTETPGLSDSQPRNGIVRAEHGSHMPSQHLTNQTSQSSVTTSDFFPTNTHEHSFGKYMLRKTSGPATRSGEHLSSPQKDFSSDITSPISEQQHRMTAPPVSPANPADFRNLTFFRDAVSIPCGTYESVSLIVNSLFR
jgi:hypothetical protein